MYISIFFCLLGLIKGFSDVSKPFLGSLAFKEVKSFWNFNIVDKSRPFDEALLSFWLLFKIFNIFEKLLLLDETFSVVFFKLFINSWIFKLVLMFLFSVIVLSLLEISSVKFWFSSVTGILVTWCLRWGICIIHSKHPHKIWHVVFWHIFNHISYLI